MLCLVTYKLYDMLDMYTIRGVFSKSIDDYLKHGIEFYEYPQYSIEDRQKKIIKNINSNLLNKLNSK